MEDLYIKSIKSVCNNLVDYLKLSNCTTLDNDCDYIKNILYKIKYKYSKHKLFR